MADVDGSEKRHKLICFAYACFLLLWQLCAFAELVQLQFDHELFFLRRGGQPYISDFVNLYTAGALSFSEDRLRAYDPLVQSIWRNRFIYPEHLDTVFYFQYPPFAFPLLSPLALLPISGAYWVWCSLGLIAGGVAVYHLLKLLNRLDQRQRLTFIIGFLASMPVWQSLRLGQLSLIMLMLLSLFLLFLIKRRHFLSGACLALSTIKPQYTLFFAIPPLVMKRWQTVAWSLIVEALLLLVAGLSVGWTNIWNYPHILARAETATSLVGTAQQEMVSLRGFLTLASAGLPIMPVSIGLLAVGLIAVWLLWGAANKENVDSCAWPAALTVVISLLCSPHAHAQDLVFLAIPAALTLRSVSIFDLKKDGPASYKWWCRILILYPLLSWLLFLTRPLWILIKLQLFAVINLLLLILGLRCWWPARRKS